MLIEKESFRAEDTYALGKKIGEEARPGEVYTLIGDLGVGKTVFTPVSYTHLRAHET